MLKRVFLIGIVTLVSFAFSDGLNASPTVTLDLDDVPFQDAMARLFKCTGESFVLEPGMRQDQKVTMKLRGVELDKALKQICDANGLVWRKEDKVYIIYRGANRNENSFTLGWAGVPGLGNFAFENPLIQFFDDQSPSGDGPRVRPRVTMRLCVPQTRLDKFWNTYRNLNSIANRENLNTHYVQYQLKNLSSQAARGKMHFVPNLTVADFDNDGMIDLLYSGRTEERSVFKCPHCKKSATVVGRSMICGKCNRVFERNWKYCPFDGTRKNTPLDNWKVCPFCGKKVASTEASQVVPQASVPLSLSASRG